MISLEKLNILTPLQKLPTNVGDLGKLIVVKGFKNLPKVQSGHAGGDSKSPATGGPSSPDLVSSSRPLLNIFWPLPFSANICEKTLNV